MVLNLISKWCIECRELYNLYGDYEIKNLLRGYEIRFYDVDEYPHMLNRFNFGGLPCIVFINDNRLLYGFSGTPTKKELIKIIERINFYQPTMLSDLSEEEPDKRDLREEDLARISSQILKGIDWVDGGFTEKYKFPHLDENLFLLKMFLRRGIEGYLKMIEYNINKMLMNGLWNNELGALARMSMVNDWSKPYKIYLLETNSKILKTLYFLKIIKQKKKYIKYIEKLAVLLGKKLYREGFLRGIYIFDGEPILDDRIIPYVSFEASRDILEVAKFGEFKKLASKAVKTLKDLDNIKEKYRNLYTYTALLDLYIEAYSYTGMDEYLEEAIDKYNYLRLKFRDGSGAFRDAIDLEFSDIIRRPFKVNSELANALIKLYHLTDDDKFRKDAYEILRYYSTLYPRHGYDIGLYGNALDSYLHGLAVLWIHGYRQIPHKIIKILKPFILYRWEKEGRSIEYVDKEIRLKLI